jgi:hypothetical protein
MLIEARNVTSSVPFLVTMNSAVPKRRPVRCFAYGMTPTAGVISNWAPVYILLACRVRYIYLVYYTYLVLQFF